MHPTLFFASLIPTLNFAVFLFTVIAILQLAGALQSYQNCRLAPNLEHNDLRGPCSIITTDSMGGCDDWTCLLWSISMIVLATVWYLFQLQDVSNLAISSIQANSFMWGAWLSPIWLMMTISGIVGVVVSLEATNVIHDEVNPGSEATPNTGSGAAAWSAVVLLGLCAGMDYWRGPTSSFAYPQQDRGEGTPIMEGRKQE